MNFTYCLTTAASAKGIVRVCWSLPLLTQGVCQQMVFLWRVAWRVCTGCSAHPYAFFTPLFWSVHLQSKSPHIMCWYGRALGWRFFSFIAEDSRAKVTEPAVTNPPISSHTATPALREAERPFHGVNIIQQAACEGRLPREAAPLPCWRRRAPAAPGPRSGSPPGSRTGPLQRGETGDGSGREGQDRARQMAAGRRRGPLPCTTTDCVMAATAASRPPHSSALLCISSPPAFPAVECSTRRARRGGWAAWNGTFRGRGVRCGGWAVPRVGLGMVPARPNSRRCSVGNTEFNSILLFLSKTVWKDTFFLPQIYFPNTWFTRWCKIY